MQSLSRESILREMGGVETKYQTAMTQVAINAEQMTQLETNGEQHTLICVSMWDSHYI